MDNQKMKTLGLGVLVGFIVGAGALWMISKSGKNGGARSACFQSGSEVERVLATIDGKEISSSTLPADVQQSYMQAESEYLRRLVELSDEVAVRYVAAKEQNKPSSMSEIPSFKDLVSNAVKDSDVREFFDKNKQSFPKMEFAQVESMLRKHLEQQKQNIFVQGKLGELKREKRLVSKLPIPCGPKAATSAPSSAPTRGTGSKVELVFLSDYQCGPCRYMKASLDRLLEQNGDRMKLVQVMFPGKAGSTNEFLVRGTFCANKQANVDKFWAYHNGAYFTPVQYDATGKVQDLADVKKSALESAKRAGLDLAAFEACLSSKEADEYVAQNRNYFAKVKVEQAPAFFLNDKRLGVPPQLNVDELLNDVMNEMVPQKTEPEAKPKSEPKIEPTKK